MPLYSVRVRGIYATALAVLLHKRGFLLSDLSDVLKRRLAGVALPAGAAPDVTVKSLDDRPDELLIIGYPWESGVEVERAILDTVGYAAIRRGRLGLYTVVDAISLGGCRARLPEGLEGQLESGPCPPEGEPFRATVSREALEPGSIIRLRHGVRVIGKYLMLHAPGSGVSFSEHIRSDDVRAELLSALQGRVDASKYHIHFRSASREAKPEEVAAEASRLLESAEGLLSEKPGGEPRIVSRGEYISILHLPRPAKEVLDQLRAEVVPTIRFHHSLKASGREESKLVDFAEGALARGACGDAISEATLGFIAGELRGRVHIDHYRPDGRRYRLGPFRVESVSPGEEGVRITLSRTFTSRGILDGLGVEKNPGDRATTTVDTTQWHVIHEYIARDGRLLGVYANVNTPPEIGLQGIRYLDLYVDVILRPGEEPEIIDEEELEKAYNEGQVSEQLYRRALDEARRLAGRLKSMYY